MAPQRGGKPAPRSRSTTPRTPGQRAGVTSALVLQCARQLARREGVDAVTMRRLATELGIAPNALYSHYESKTAILDAVLDSILGEIALPERCDEDWRTALTAILRHSREALLTHPTLIAVFVARPGGPNALRLGEAMLAALASARVTGPRAVMAMRALLTYTLGAAMIQAPRDADPNRAQRAANTAALLRSALGTDALLSAQADVVTALPDDEEFETGLAWLIDGITAGE